MRRQLTILGVKITDQGFSDAVAQLGGMAMSGGRARTLYYVNASTLNLSATDDDYRAVLNRSDLVFGDGTGVRWAAKFRGVDMQANLNGTDLTPALIKSQPGIKVYLLGSSPDDIGPAADAFNRLFPGAELVGARHGFFERGDEAGIIASINAAQPHLLLVGMGNPLQERFLDRNRAALTVPLIAGVGGLFDFWSGKRSRAPKWLRMLGHEWLHILVTERHKAKRYLLGNPAFLLRMLTWRRRDQAEPVMMATPSAAE
jgi:N-acetylglucosaminyldiphosphoundecaprenol N-acetyl-beta-D-mannosaminyltransferase